MSDQERKDFEAWFSGMGPAWNGTNEAAQWSAWQARAALAQQAGDWINADDVQRLTRELDVLLNGEEGAAAQASLCDLVAQVRVAKQAAPQAEPKGMPFLARDVAELLGIGVPELSAALVALGFPQRSQGMTIEPLEALAVYRAQAPAVTHEPLTDEEKGDRWRELLPHSGDWGSADWFEAGACFAENAYRNVPSTVAAGTDDPKPVLYVRCIDGTYREAQAHER